MDVFVLDELILCLKANVRQILTNSFSIISGYIFLVYIYIYIYIYYIIYIIYIYLPTNRAKKIGDTL